VPLGCIPAIVAGTPMAYAAVAMALFSHPTVDDVRTVANLQGLVEIYIYILHLKIRCAKSVLRT
jgi:hypothetical protein